MEERKRKQQKDHRCVLAQMMMMGVVYYKIPTRMTRSQKKHLLSDAIKNNYSASHKHGKTMY